jgi:hypothetical protein
MIPTDAYSEEEASRAVADATFVVDTVGAEIDR